MLVFNKFYLTSAIVLFIIEVLIALSIHDQIIRPYGGDFLVVILLYCMLKTFLALKPAITAAIVLIFSFLIEVAQYFNLINLLGLQNNTFAKTILGTFFTWTDILAYTLGTLFILFIEHIINLTKSRYLSIQKIES